MPKLRKQEVKNGFTQVPNDILNCESLSLKSKGLWGYIWGKPDGWDFAIERIQKENSDGKDSVRNAIIELEKAGYLERKRMKTGRMEYYIYYEPTAENPPVATSGKSHRGKIPQRENPPSNKERDISNTELDSKKDVGADAPASPGKICNAQAIDISLAEIMFRGIQKHSDIFARKYVLESGEISAEGRKRVREWAEDIEKMRRLDKATEFEIEFILTFIYGGRCRSPVGKEFELNPYEGRNNFNWYSNIESGKKLRIKFQRLVQDAKGHFQFLQDKKENSISPLNIDALEKV